MGYFVKTRQIINGTNSITIPAGTSAMRPDIAVFGTFRYNTDLGALEYFNGINYVKVGNAGSISYVVDDFTGDGSTTTFTMSSGAAATTQIIVFVGSIYQDPSNSYTLSGVGNIDINFVSAPPSGEPIRIIHSSTP